MGGTILTWMSDKKAPVFVVQQQIILKFDPAYVEEDDLMRFFIDLPGVKARRNLLHHLQKRYPRLISQTLASKFARESNGFTGAEIEALIVEAKNHARSVDSAITPQILNKCLDNMTPDSVAMTKTITYS